DGRPLRPDLVPLTDEGREQACAAAAVLEGVEFDRVITSGLPGALGTGRRARAPAAVLEGVECDRVITSGLPRTLETARIVAPGMEPESWPELREIESGRLGDIPEDELERAFVETWRGVVPEEARFLAGET